MFIEKTLRTKQRFRISSRKPRRETKTKEINRSHLKNRIEKLKFKFPFRIRFISFGLVCYACNAASFVVVLSKVPLILIQLADMVNICFLRSFCFDGFFVSMASIEYKRKAIIDDKSDQSNILSI